MRHHAILETRTEPAPLISPSIVPAIDHLVTQFLGRDLIAAHEVVDGLLDLRLIVMLDETANAPH